MVLPMTTLGPLSHAVAQPRLHPHHALARDKEFDAVNRWYRGRQAAMVVKTAWSAACRNEETDERLGAGFASAAGAYPLAVGGYKSTTFDKLWPAAYTYKLLIEKLDGMTACRRLPMPEYVYVYECTVRGGRKVHVAFYDDHIAPEPRRAARRARRTHPAAGRPGASHAHRHRARGYQPKTEMLLRERRLSLSPPDRIPGLSRTWSGTTGPRFSLPGALDPVILATLWLRIFGLEDLLPVGLEQILPGFCDGLLGPVGKGEPGPVKDDTQLAQKTWPIRKSLACFSAGTPRATASSMASRITAMQVAATVSDNAGSQNRHLLDGHPMLHGSPASTWPWPVARPSSSLPRGPASRHKTIGWRASPDPKKSNLACISVSSLNTDGRAGWQTKTVMSSRAGISPACGPAGSRQTSGCAGGP